MRRIRAIALALTIGMTMAVAIPTISGAATSTPLKTVKVKSAGISVKYPSAWTATPLTKAGLQRAVTILEDKNPKLAAALQSADLSKAKFFAIDPAATTFASNINVQGLNGTKLPSLASFTDQVTQAYTQAGAKVLDSKAVKINGKTAYRTDVQVPIKAADGTTIAAREGQLFITKPGSGAVVTVSTTDDPAGAALVDTLLGAVRRI